MGLETLWLAVNNVAPYFHYSSYKVSQVLLRTLFPYYATETQNVVLFLDMIWV